MSDRRNVKKNRTWSCYGLASHRWLGPVKKSSIVDERRFGRFKSQTDELPRNVRQFFTDHFVVTIRPLARSRNLNFIVSFMATLTNQRTCPLTGNQGES